MAWGYGRNRDAWWEPPKPSGRTGARRLSWGHDDNEYNDPDEACNRRDSYGSHADMTVLHPTVGTKVIPATALAVADGIAVIKLPTSALLNVLVRMYSKHTAAPHSLMPQAATNDETTDRMPCMTLHQTAATVVVG